MEYNWDFSFILGFIPALLKGLWVTCYISILSIVFGTLVGIGAALLRRSSHWLPRAFASTYINIFLAIPVLVLMVWLYYCLPIIAKIRLDSAETAILSLSLSLGGFIGDIVRGGIDSLPRGQAESGLTLGLSRQHIMNKIILPQAIRIMIPPILGQYVTCIKLSALASIIAVNDLLHSASNIISITYRPMETYTIVAILYLAIIWPLVRIMRFFEIRTVNILTNKQQVTFREYFKWFRGA